MEKSVLLQKQVKDNSEDLQNEFLDLKNWEEQMKRKDNDLKKEAGGEVILPPVRTKNKKKTQKVIAKENENNDKPKRIKSYDYSAWDKFDVDSACKEIDKEEQFCESGDELMSKEELEKAHEEATKHKQEGNVFVQNQEWNKAITCYSEAIKAFSYDAVFYANRALCHLKLDNLHEAEADCSTAIQLNETYVKAYLRRVSARMGLKQYKEAKQDLDKIFILEPNNKEAKSLLQDLNKKTAHTKTGNLKDISLKVEKRDPRIPAWLPEKNDVAVVEPINKPPHLRSKKSLIRIPVEEVDFSAMQFNDDADKTVCNKGAPVQLPKTTMCDVLKGKKDSTKLVESSMNFADNEIPQIPKTAVQFLMNWNRNKSPEYRYKYLKQLHKSSLPHIFQESMESSTFSEILHTLRTEFMKREDSVFWYLEDLSQVKRFRALIMFISNADKEGLRQLFVYCKTHERISEEKVASLRQKYEV